MQGAAEQNMPYDMEAEQAVLGIIIYKSSQLPQAMEKLPSGDYFYDPMNREIYSSMIDLFTMNKSVDYVTVMAKMREKNKFPEDEMKQYIFYLTKIVPSTTSIMDYAEIVRERYFVRKLITAARDIIDYTYKNGSEKSSELINAAEQKIFDIRENKDNGGLQRVSETIIETYDRLDFLNSPNSDDYKAISTGIGALDNTITGLNRSDLIILAARPGMGKSSFALNIAKYVSVKVHKKVAFFSLEMSKEQLVSRLLSMEGLIAGTKLRTGRLSNDEWQRLIEAGGILSKAELYIDDNSNISVPEIKAKLKRMRDIDLVIIDYLQLMKPSRPINNHVQEVSEITRDLKILAKELEVPVITLSQLSRASEQRAEHKPQLSDLRDSGSIEQDADIVLFLYREDYYKEKDDQAPSDTANSGECIVAKNRHGETRSVPLHWQGEFMRFTAEG